MAYPPEDMHYWSLLESTQEHLFPDFVQHLRRQQGPTAEEGKAALIEFSDNAASPSVRRLKSSRALRRSLEDIEAQIQPATSTLRRRIFVLEGLPRNYIQILGAKLRVPPAFFASQWKAVGFVGHLLNRNPRQYDNTNRFILNFPKLHQARVKALREDEEFPFYHMDYGPHCPLSRTTIFGDADGPLSSPEQVSFWSKLDRENWDGILLVDAPLGSFVRWRDGTPREVEHLSSIELGRPAMASLEQRGSWYPPIITSTVAIGPNSADRKDEKCGQLARSTFEDILKLYSCSPDQRRSIRDPNTCVDLCRGLVLSAWTAAIRVVEAQLVQEQLALTVGVQADDIRATDVFEKSWERPWHPRDFGRLVRAKLALDSVDWDLSRNMDALGILELQHQSHVEAWEADAWHGLRDVVHNLKAKLDIMSQAYMQSISIRETHAANQQARNVGYLTSLASIFVPISFVAAVFSMGGDFSAGESRFWVYWVVAVPVGAIVSLMLFTRIGRRLMRRISERDSPV